MSKKIEDALVALELRTTKICNASGSQVIKTIFDEECNKQTGIILAEFEKLNAVREKLVEACKAFPGDNWAEKKAAALTANAELEEGK